MRERKKVWGTFYPVIFRLLPRHSVIKVKNSLSSDQFQQGYVTIMTLSLCKKRLLFLLKIPQGKMR